MANCTDNTTELINFLLNLPSEADRKTFDTFLDYLLICENEKDTAMVIVEELSIAYDDYKKKYNRENDKSNFERNTLDKISVLIDNVPLYYNNGRQDVTPTYLSSVISAIQLFVQNEKSKQLSDWLQNSTNEVFESMSTVNKMYKEQDEKFDKYADELKGYSEELREYDERFEKQEKKLNDLLPQSITVVGIFVAIITVMLGGVHSFLTFSGIEHPFRLIGVGMFVAFLIANCLFLLVFLLARISGKSIFTICRGFTNQNVTKADQMTCHRCFHQRLGDRGKIEKIVENENGESVSTNYNKEQCSFIKTAFSRYPWFWATNITFSLVGIFLISGWYFKTMYPNYIKDDMQLWFAVSLIVAILFIIAAIVLIFASMGHKKIKDTKKKKDDIVLSLKKRAPVIIVLFTVGLGSLGFHIFGTATLEKIDNKTSPVPVNEKHILELDLKDK